MSVATDARENPPERPHASKPVKPRFGRSLAWMQRAIIATLILLFFAALLVLLVWMNRGSVVEYFAERQLAKRGFDIQMDIVEVDPNYLNAKDVVISYGGKRVASAKAIEADYVFEDFAFKALSRLKLDGVDVDVAVNESGEVTSPWFQALTGGAATGGGFELPKDGIFITDSHATVDSPYGVYDFDLAADIRSRFDLDAKVSFEDNRIQSEVFNGVLDGTLIASQEGEGIIALQGGLTIANLVASDIRADELSFNSNLYFAQAPEGKTLGVTGRLSAEGRNFSAPGVVSRALKLDSDNTLRLDPENWAESTVNSAVTVTAEDSGLTNPELVTTLSNALTANEGLKAAPISTHFADRLTLNLRQLLELSNLTYKGRIVRDAEGMELTVSEPLRLYRSADHRARLTPETNRPVFRYTAGTDDTPGVFSIAGDVDYVGGEALRLDNLRVEGRADGPFSWTKIRTVSTGVATQSEWIAKDAVTGSRVRLAPFTARLNVDNRASGPRIRVDMNLDYDGPLPGGLARGLVTSGQLYVQPAGQQIAVSFKPKAGTRVVLDNFDSPIGWRAENMAFDYRGDTPFFTSGEPAKLTAQLLDISGRLVSEEQGQDFTLDIAELDVDAQFFEARQDWNMDMTDAHIVSDTFPGPDSDIRATTLNVKLNQTLDKAVYFEAKSPNATVKSPLFSLKKVAVKAQGTPSAYSVDYSGGKMKLASAPLIPELPVTGQAQLLDTVWRGQAVTSLPLTQDAPITLDFDYSDGAGEVRVDIENLKFSPDGLQVENLVPQLRGRVADVNGIMSAKLVFGFAEGQEMTSRGSVNIPNMDFGTLVGPFKGVETQLTFDSIIPLTTDGPQTLKMAKFNPGIPLDEGSVTFEILDEGVQLIEMFWPVEQGRIAVEPTLWRPGKKNRVVVQVTDINLEYLLQRFGNKKFKATGRVFGTLPINIDGVNVLVDKGELYTEGGGRIQFQSEATDAASDKNEISKMVFQSLKDFQYEKLSAEIDGPLDGNIVIYSTFLGSNPDVLGGAEFLFRTRLEGDLFNIARSFTIGGRVESELKNVIAAVEKQGINPYDILRQEVLKRGIEDPK